MFLVSFRHPPGDPAHLIAHDVFERDMHTVSALAGQGVVYAGPRLIMTKPVLVYGWPARQA